MPLSQVCVDASIIVKLLVNEHDSARARELWRRWERERIEAVAPALVLFETVSVLRRYVSRGLLSLSSGRRSLSLLLAMPISFPAPAGLPEKTWELAARLRRPTAYDSFYLALAEILDIPFWTADASLHHAVHRELPRVHLLEEQSD